MAQLIEAAFRTGQTLYAVIFAPDGKVWNTDTLAFEVFNGSHWDKYSTELAETGATGYYSAEYPAQISGTLTTEALYQQAGGSPNITDATNGPIGLGQSQGANIALVAGSASAASNLQTAADTELQGAAVSGTLTNSSMTTNLASSVNDAFVGRVVFFTSGDNVNQVANITAYNGTSKLLSFSPVTATVAVDDTFIII